MRKNFLLCLLLGLLIGGSVAVRTVAAPMSNDGAFMNSAQAVAMSSIWTLLEGMDQEEIRIDFDILTKHRDTKVFKQAKEAMKAGQQDAVTIMKICCDEEDLVKEKLEKDECIGFAEDVKEYYAPYIFDAKG